MATPKIRTSGLSQINTQPGTYMLYTRADYGRLGYPLTNG